MSKKTRIILISSIVAVIVIILAIVMVASKHQENRAVMFSEFFENKVATSLEEAEKMDMSKPLVVLFHAPYCGNCQKFMPAFNKLSKDLSRDYNFVMLNTEEPQNYPLVVGNVYTIPTLYIFDTSIGNKIVIPLQTVRTYGELKSEFDRYTRIRSFIDIPKAQAKHQELMDAYAQKLAKKEKK